MINEKEKERKTEISKGHDMMILIQIPLSFGLNKTCSSIQLQRWA